MPKKKFKNRCCKWCWSSKNVKVYTWPFGRLVCDRCYSEIQRELSEVCLAQPTFCFEEPAA